MSSENIVYSVLKEQCVGCIEAMYKLNILFIFFILQCIIIRKYYSLLYKKLFIFRERERDVPWIWADFLRLTGFIEQTYLVFLPFSAATISRPVSLEGEG